MELGSVGDGELEERVRRAPGDPLYLSERAETDPDARRRVTASFDRWNAAVRDGLVSMLRAGRLAPDADPVELATALVAAVQGGLLFGQLLRSTCPLRAALDTIIEAIEARIPPAAGIDAVAAPTGNASRVRVSFEIVRLRCLDRPGAVAIGRFPIHPARDGATE